MMASKINHFHLKYVAGRKGGGYAGNISIDYQRRAHEINKEQSTRMS